MTRHLVPRFIISVFGFAGFGGFVDDGVGDGLALVGVGEVAGEGREGDEGAEQ